MIHNRDISLYLCFMKFSACDESYQYNATSGNSTNATIATEEKLSSLQRMITDESQTDYSKSR